MQQAPIYSGRADLYNTNSNLNEELLTPANVATGGAFGQLWRTQLNGAIFTQPLFVPQLSMNLNGAAQVHDATFVGTVQNIVYALDANTGQILWQTVVQQATRGGTIGPVPGQDTMGATASNFDYWGIVGTPISELWRRGSPTRTGHGQIYVGHERSCSCAPAFSVLAYAFFVRSPLRPLARVDLQLTPLPTCCTCRAP